MMVLVLRAERFGDGVLLVDRCGPFVLVLVAEIDEHVGFVLLLGQRDLRVVLERLDATLAQLVPVYKRAVRARVGEHRVCARLYAKLLVFFAHTIHE